MAEGGIEVGVQGKVVGRPDAEEMASLEQRLGLRLPPSYRRWVSRFGAGEIEGDGAIWVPSRELDCFAEHSARLQQINREVAVAEASLFEDEGFRELLGRLVPFGNTWNGAHVAWDPNALGDDGEMAVHWVQRGSTSGERIGKTVFDAVRTIAERSVAFHPPRVRFRCRRDLQNQRVLGLELFCDEPIDMNEALLQRFEAHVGIGIPGALRELYLRCNGGRLKAKPQVAGIVVAQVLPLFAAEGVGSAIEWLFEQAEHLADADLWFPFAASERSEVIASRGNGEVRLFRERGESVLLAASVPAFLTSISQGGDG